MFKKTIGWLHLWLGLGSGVIVFVVSLTGCLHVFHEEVLEYFPRPNQQAPKIEIASEGRPLLSPSEIVRRVENSQHGDSVRIDPFMLRYHREAASILLAGDDSDENRMWYTVNPYTAEVLEVKLQQGTAMFNVIDGKVQAENLIAFDFFDFILDGHLNLWLPPKIGNVLVSYGTLIFAVMLLSGLILWWPKNKSAAKQRYWFRWKKSTEWRRKNYDLHNVNGFYMFILLLLISLTGLAIGLEWVNESIHWLASLGKESKEVVFASKQPSNARLIPDFNSTLDPVLSAQDRDYPEAKTYSMYWSYPSRKIPTSVIRVVTYLKDGSKIGIYDRYTSKFLGFEQHDEEDLAHQIEELYLPIHEGAIWGLPTKILAFVASLISASLPVTGFYIWWGRRKKKGGRGDKRPGRQLARPKDVPLRIKPVIRTR